VPSCQATARGLEPPVPVARDGPPAYRRREPEQTLLHRTMREHLKTFLRRRKTTVSIRSTMSEPARWPRREGCVQRAPELSLADPAGA